MASEPTLKERILSEMVIPDDEFIDVVASLKRRYRKIDKVEREKIVNLFKLGGNTKEICESMNLPKGVVVRALRTAGFHKGERGGRHGRKITRGQIIEIKILQLANVRPHTIAQQFGVNKYYIYQLPKIVVPPKNWSVTISSSGKIDIKYSKDA